MAGSVLTNPHFLRVMRVPLAVRAPVLGGAVGGVGNAVIGSEGSMGERFARGAVVGAGVTGGAALSSKGAKLLPSVGKPIKEYQRSSGRVLEAAGQKLKDPRLTEMGIGMRQGNERVVRRNLTPENLRVLTDNGKRLKADSRIKPLIAEMQALSPANKRAMRTRNRAAAVGGPLAGLAISQALPDIEKDPNMRKAATGITEQLLGESGNAHLIQRPKVAPPRSQQSGEAAVRRNQVPVRRGKQAWGLTGKNLRRYVHHRNRIQKQGQAEEIAMEKEAIMGAITKGLVKAKNLATKAVTGKTVKGLRKAKLQKGVAQYGGAYRRFQKPGRVSLSSAEAAAIEKMAQADTEGRMMAQASFFSQVEKTAAARGVDPAEIIKEAASSYQKRVTKQNTTMGNISRKFNAAPQSKREPKLGRKFRHAWKGSYDTVRAMPKQSSAEELGKAANSAPLWAPQKSPDVAQKRLKPTTAKPASVKPQGTVGKMMTQTKTASVDDVATFEKLAYYADVPSAGYGHDGLGSFKGQIGSVGGANWSDQFKDSPLYQQALQLELGHKTIKAQQAEMHERHQQENRARWKQQEQIREQSDDQHKAESDPVDQQLSQLKQMSFQLETQLIQTKMGIEGGGEQAGLEQAVQQAPPQAIPQQQGQQQVQEQPGAVITGQGGQYQVNTQTDSADGEYPTI